jgi:DNA adenine methylase
MGGRRVKPTRPLLRYHGGKWRLAPWVIGFFPPHRVYVEPFGGAASVLLRKARSYAEVYNDLYSDVVLVFSVLRDPAKSAELERRLRLTPFARDEFEDAYRPGFDEIENVRRMLIRSYMGFGATGVMGHITGFRRNSNRSGTTPAHDWSNYAASIPAFTSRLQGVVIENRPASDLLGEFDGPETLFYVDPPYVHSTRTLGNPHCAKHRYREEMRDDDHRRLGEQLRSLEGMVVLSGYPCDLYDLELFPDWQRHERRHLADGARPRTEVVWLNPACVAALTASREQIELAQ